mmetsp:Transcript_30323/g.33874  ORF Transcript_30323/g.33874 Transcript_30323/m.33874 type:complete len:93 (+) Transcript_30323:40-318(+)
MSQGGEYVYTYTIGDDTIKIMWLLKKGVWQKDKIVGVTMNGKKAENVSFKTSSMPNVNEEVKFSLGGKDFVLFYFKSLERWCISVQRTTLKV